MSIEYQVELCNKLGVDGWFNGPHLVDDYIFNMAVFINNTIPSNLRACIEYSNEVWNWAPAFAQTKYASAVALIEGDLKWYGRESSQVFSIIDRVFGSSARTRLVTVVAFQVGRGHAQMSLVGFGGADALAIGPYFGSGLNSFLYNIVGWQNITVDQVLDQAQKASISDILVQSNSSPRVAKYYGLKLIAYKGGQHFLGGGNCGAVGCNNITDLQAKLMAENCSPRMKGLYQNLLKALSLAGGTTFAAFCHIGYDSRY